MTLVAVLWRARLVVAAGAAAGTVVAIIYALTATEVFRAEALVQPRQQSAQGMSLASLGARLGGLADLAGLSFGGGGDKAVSIATLKSRELVEGFIRDQNVLPRLYPAAWDQQNNKWKDPEHAPTTWQAYNDFVRSILTVVEDRKTGLVTIAVEWTDPVEAQRWVTELIARTNAHLKSAAILEGEQNLAYLENQARKIGQVELQRSLYGLMETEMNKLMVAKGGQEFAIKTIDPAFVPQKRIRPKRTRVTVLGFLVGMFGAMGFVIARTLVTGSMREAGAGELE